MPQRRIGWIPWHGSAGAKTVVWPCGIRTCMQSSCWCIEFQCGAAHHCSMQQHLQQLLTRPASLMCMADTTGVRSQNSMWRHGSHPAMALLQRHEGCRLQSQFDADYCHHTASLVVILQIEAGVSLCLVEVAVLVYVQQGFWILIRVPGQARSTWLVIYLYSMTLHECMIHVCLNWVRFTFISSAL